MMPRTRLKLHKSQCCTLIWVAALGLIGFTALAGPEINKEKTPPSSEWLTGDGITGTWGGLGAKPLDRGVEFFGGYNVEVWGNTTGGLERGTLYTGLLDFGLNLDLEKAVGWRGASLSTKWLWLSGRDASADLVGNFLTVSNIAGFNTLRNYELWFQQNLLNDKISLRLGQLAADTEFVISDYAATFINGTFGFPASMYMNLPGGGPGYPMGTLGVRLAINPVNWFKFQTAVFQGNVYAQNVNLHGFRWRLDSANGFFFLNEAQFRWNREAEERGLPGQCKGGAWFHTARFNKFNNEGVVRGNYGFYFILDQMLYREPGEMAERPAATRQDGKSALGAAGGNKGTLVEQKSDRGLGFFGRIAFEPQDRNFIGFYFDTGLTYKGLIPSRNEDILGAAFAYAQLSSGAKQEAIDDGSVGVAAEMALEVTYQAQITHWLGLQPDLQYIINPGGNQDFGHALVMGCHVSVAF